LGAAAFFILPWMVKNAIFASNPFAPFTNWIFPNPYVHVSLEQQYAFFLRHYQLTNLLHAPWELTVKGERLQGFFGPVFLLTPLALLSLRWRDGRRLLLAAAVFALPWFLNIGSRFLIPAMPPLALALALALRHPPTLLPGIAILHGLLSWYASPLRYFDDYAPRLSTFPFRAALRLQPENIYLERNSFGYRIDSMIEQAVPPGEKVFSFDQIAEAWTTREVLAGYTSAEGEVLTDILRTGLDPSFYPIRAWSFRFAPQHLRRLQAIQTAPPAEQMWSISEFQIFGQDRMLEFDRAWRFRADPNPWDVSLAFDGKPVTRWRSWDRATPGMFVEVDFGKSMLIDEARMITTPDALQTRVTLRGMDDRGDWRTLGVQGSSLLVDTTSDLRRAATQALISRGIRYLLISPGTFGANDFNDNASAWGVQQVKESGGMRLYRLNTTYRATPLADRTTASQPDPAPPGAYDDSDSRIDLHAAWTRDTQFPDADRHTLTYSNIPGAVASFQFSGKTVTYIYTRAHNRGRAEVLIDGLVKDRLDLYSADTVWKSRARYDSLGHGPHALQIRVTGQRNPRATNCFVDLDALVVE
jgi:hypothetical protein